MQAQIRMTSYLCFRGIRWSQRTCMLFWTQHEL